MAFSKSSTPTPISKRFLALRAKSFKELSIGMSFFSSFVASFRFDSATFLNKYQSVAANTFANWDLADYSMLTIPSALAKNRSQQNT